MKFKEIRNCPGCVYYSVCPDERMVNDADCYIAAAPLRLLQQTAKTAEAYIQRTKDYITDKKLASTFWKSHVS